MTENPFRWYSEREHPLGPPPPRYDVDDDGAPTVRLRDQRSWISIEYARRVGIPVPANWRQLR